MSSWVRRAPMLVFLCNWAPYRSYLEWGSSARSLPPPFYPVRVMCAGRVDPAMLLFAFERGAEGVLVLGCRERECRHGSGPQQLVKRAEMVRGLMGTLGLEPERLATLELASGDGDRLAAELEAFARKIGALGKSPLGR